MQSTLHINNLILTQVRCFVNTKIYKLLLSNLIDWRGNRQSGLPFGLNFRSDTTYYPNTACIFSTILAKIAFSLR